MSSEVDINAVVRSWRKGVKNKFRGIADFEERVGERLAEIERRVFPDHEDLSPWRIQEFDYQSWDEREHLGPERDIHLGERWGGGTRSAFFRRQVRVPERFAGRKLALRLFVGGDTLVRIDGAPFHGIDPFRHELILPGVGQAGHVYEVELETYMNFHAPRQGEDDHPLALARLCTVDDEMWAAYWDLWCAIKMLHAELEPSLAEWLEHHCFQAMRLVPLQEGDEERFRAAVAAARTYIRDRVYASDRFKVAGKFHFVGHSHLDVVFMWQHKEYLRKIGRTHASMLRLMDEFPEFKFSQSQARIYADLERLYPELFAEIKQRVAEGRWEPIGAFWVEPDCNLVSGESFVRQILFGQRFFERAFGLRSRTCWQPDVFGLSWALPQIMAKSGLKYFTTTKMVPWNDTNPWKLNNFWWEGPDGSRVLGIVQPGHFIGTVDPDMMLKQWRNFRDKATIGETTHIYGWGDGGGGVDREMIESARRYRDFPGLPRGEFATVEEAFDAIAGKVEVAEEVPVLRDEIYLEAHRGAVTTKGRLKKYNRRAEHLLREVELLHALSGQAWPEDELRAVWEQVLDAQMHDALPGTHIPPVYEDLKALYGEVFARAEALRVAALERLAPPAAGRLACFNPLAADRDDVVAVPADLVGEGLVADARGAVLAQQAVTDLAGGRGVLVAAGVVAGCGLRDLRLIAGGTVPQPADVPLATDRSLENAALRAEFDDHGRLVRLYDKITEREVLPAGGHGNVFQMFDDTPGKYDAWDIVATHKYHPLPTDDGPVSLAVEEHGPLRAGLLLDKRFAGSRIRQRISLVAGEGQLRFETEIDWVERRRLLKVAFPVDVNADHATFDIAYGSIERANQPKNDWESARFEVNCHQWFDLSDYGYGAALLNDGKYGCDVHANVLRQTLLKGSVNPDPEADREVHHFTYVFKPHRGGWREGGVATAAARLNQPHTVVAGAAEDGRRLLELDGEHLVVEAVKRAEDGSGDLVVRVTERANARTRARLRIPGLALAAASSVDLMEEGGEALAVDGDAVAFTAGPREIVTLRLRPV